MYCDFAEFDLALPGFDLEHEPTGECFNDESAFVSSPVAEPFEPSEFPDHGIDSFLAQVAPPPKPRKKKIASAVFHPFERLGQTEMTVQALNKFLNNLV